MIFRLDNVTQSLAYRASGGDDDTMPWTELAVIEPPKVVVAGNRRDAAGLYGPGPPVGRPRGQR